MELYEIRSSHGRRIQLPINVTKDGLEDSVESILSVIEQLIALELHINMLKNSNALFYIMEIKTNYKNTYKTWEFELTPKNADFVNNAVMQLAPLLRLEIECNLLRTLL